MKKTTIMLAVLLLSSAAFAQERTAQQSASNRVVSFVEVKGEPEYEPQRFEYSTEKYRYRISSNGRGTRSGGGAGVQRFYLRLAAGDSLERSIYYVQYEGDLLLICEVGDGESGAGFITRLDGRTLRMKWKRPIPGFNVGPGLVEGNHAYLTAIGFIAKVNLSSGVFAWKHSNLYRNNHFNFFELPRVEDAVVTFKEVTYNEPARTISVDKQTGRVISGSLSR